MAFTADGIHQDNSIIAVKSLVSQERYTKPDGTDEPLFSGITFSVASGECFGISSTNPKTADALCRIVGNTNPYFSGSCRIGLIGSMQKKRRILPHIFNIDTPEMLSEHANVLEELMLVTMSEKTEASLREERLLDLLVETGLSYIALNMISSLTDNEKLILELLIASLSGSSVTIFNVVGYTFLQHEVEIIANIVSRIREQNRSVVLATLQPKVIGMVCDSTVYIHHGQQLFFGTVEELCKNADKVGFVLRDRNAQQTAEAIEKGIPGWECDIDGDTVYIFNYSGKPTVAADFYRFLADNGICPDDIKSNRGRVENSYTELLRNYALHR